MMIQKRLNFWSFLTGAGIVHHVYVVFNTLAWHIFVDPQQSLSHRQALIELPSLVPEKLLDQDHRHHHHHHHKAASLFPDSCQANISAWDKIYEKGDDSHHGNIQPHSAFYNNATTAFPAKTRAARDLKSSKQTTTLKILQTVIREHAIETMIDIPCGGDVNWILDSWETDGALKLYVGFDVVPAVITSNQKRLAHHSNKVFRVWDGTQCPMPRIVLFDKKGQPQQQDQPVDLIHTRANVLQHLPPDHALNFLCNVLTSKARFFVTTTTRAAPDKKDRNLTEGTFYQHNDLSAHPFHLPSSSDDVVSCEKTHPNHDPDETETCIYDLTKPWVKEWTTAKNCPVIVQVA